MNNNNQQFVSVSNIQSQVVKRTITGIEELDWMYGYTCSTYGIPEKSISLWSGPSGTGKSRLAIRLVKSLHSMDQGWRVLYFQGEMPISTFAGHIQADPVKNRNLFLSDRMNLTDIESIIQQVQPHLVIIDSINMIPEFNSHNSDLMLNGDSTHIGLRRLCHNLAVGIIFLGQVNQDGSNKGGTSLDHLVDVHFSFLPSPQNKADEFMVKVGMKHRYGKKGPIAIFQHTDTGVSCVSSNRYYDSDWCSKMERQLRVLTTTAPEMSRAEFERRFKMAGQLTVARLKEEARQKNSTNDLLMKMWNTTMTWVLPRYTDYPKK